MRRERHRPLSLAASDHRLIYPVEIAGKVQHGRQLSLDLAGLLGVSRRPQFGAQLLDVALDREGLRGAGQGIALRRDRAAAMGVTIFLALPPKKWWGPVVP